jgi:hypothetical protein
VPAGNTLFAVNVIAGGVVQYSGVLVGIMPNGVNAVAIKAVFAFL